MRTEDTIREALRHEADRHRVNPALPGSTVVKARTARAVTVTAVAAVVAAAVFGGAGVMDALRDDGRRMAPAAGETAPAGDGAEQTADTPHLLVLEDGWRVSRADQYSPTEGQMTFTNGHREIELTWRPAELHEDYLEDRERESSGSWTIDVARRHGTLFQYEGTTDFTTLWLDGDLSLELRGVFSDREAYQAIARTLDRVDESKWLAALPERTVPPSERARVVDEMLVGVPVHPRTRLDELKESRSVSDRYQLGARVTGAVACAWIEQWVDAQAAGNEKAAREAVDAMAGSRTWPVLKEMKEQGEWPEVLWEYADSMAGDGEVVGGRTLTIEESYRDALGCRG